MERYAIEKGREEGAELEGSERVESALLLLLSLYQG